MMVAPSLQLKDTKPRRFPALSFLVAHIQFRPLLLGPSRATDVPGLLALVQRSGKARPETTAEASFSTETERVTASVVPIGSIPMSVAIMVSAVTVTAVVMPPT